MYMRGGTGFEHLGVGLRSPCSFVFIVIPFPTFSYIMYCIEVWLEAWQRKPRRILSKSPALPIVIEID